MYDTSEDLPRMIAETKRMTRMTMVQSVGRSSVRTAIEPVHQSTKITIEMIIIGAWMMR